MRDPPLEDPLDTSGLAKYSYRLRSIETLMQRLGYNGAELARHLGVNENTISLWRRGRQRAPKVVYLYLELLLKFRDATSG